MRTFYRLLLTIVLALNIALTSMFPVAFAQDIGNPQPQTETSKGDVEIQIPDPTEEALGAANGGDQPAEIKLEFRILEVYALDITDPECWKIPLVGTIVDHDQISLGGTTALRYGTQKIEYLDLGKFCDLDASRSRSYYDNPLVFHTFDLQDFSHTTSVTLIMVERDGRGGKEEFRDKLVADQQHKTEEENKDLLDPTESTVAAAATPDPDSFEAILKDSLRDKLKKVINDLVSVILAWLSGLINGTPDDIFTPQTVSVSFATANMRWAGGATTSPPGAVILDEGTGRYRVTFDWHIVTPPAVAAATASNVDDIESSAYTNWGKTPWHQTLSKFPPLWWTKPGAVQNANAVNLVAVHSNKCLTVRSKETRDGAVLEQNECIHAKETNQVFMVRQLGNYYQLVAAHSGKCLGVADGAVEDGALVQQVECALTKTKEQLWIARKLGAVDQFIAAHSGKCLSVSDVSYENGTQVHQWECIGIQQTNQLWQLQQPRPAPPDLPPPPQPGLRILYLPLVNR